MRRNWIDNEEMFNHDGTTNTTNEKNKEMTNDQIAMTKGLLVIGTCSLVIPVVLVVSLW